MSIGRKTKRSTTVDAPPQPEATVTDPQPVSLRAHAQRTLELYFESLNGHRPSGLYALVTREVEEPLFRAVMKYTEGNQVRAAEVLGINRGTLRRKLEEYGLVQ
jgi:Fis family transcriptional regulator, factor for inversion stimulation protein